MHLVLSRLDTHSDTDQLVHVLMRCNLTRGEALGKISDLRMEVPLPIEVDEMSDLAVLREQLDMIHVPYDVSRD